MVLFLLIHKVFWSILFVLGWFSLFFNRFIGFSDPAQFVDFVRHKLFATSRFSYSLKALRNGCATFILFQVEII